MKDAGLTANSDPLVKADRRLAQKPCGCEGGGCSGRDIRHPDVYCEFARTCDNNLIRDLAQEVRDLRASATPPLIAYMNATTTPERDAAFLRTYAERIRNGTDIAWDIPNTRATTIEDIARRITAAEAHREAQLTAAHAQIAQWRETVKRMLWATMDHDPDEGFVIPDYSDGRFVTAEHLRKLAALLTPQEARE